MAKRAKGEGGLFKVKGTQNWKCQYYDETGKQVRMTTGTPIKQKALAFLRKQMGDSERGMPNVTDLKKITYGDLRAGLLANYAEKGNASLVQSVDGDESIVGLKALDEFFGYSATNQGPSVTSINPETSTKFKKKRLADGVGNAMVNRSLACLRRMLRIAHEDGRIQSVPKIRLLKEPPARKGFLTVEKFEELLALLPTHLRPLIAFLYYCGVRVGEARQIEWSQVDLSAPCIRLEEGQTKNDEARIIPLHPMLVDILSAMEQKSGRVFDDTNLRVEWERACTLAGLGKRVQQTSEAGNIWYAYSGLMVHDLRRSAIRNMVTVAGVTERVAMKISGHKTRSVFDRYHIVSNEDVLDAMQKVSTKVMSKNGKTLSGDSLVTVGGSTTAVASRNQHKH